MIRYSLALTVLLAAAPGAQIQPAAPVTAAQVQAAIDKLGSFDFPVRTEASRVIRRATAEVAVPPLAKAARTHTDEYVRYRALTILSGFGGPTASAVMVFSDGASLELATMSGSVGGVLTAALTVAV